MLPATDLSVYATELEETLPAEEVQVTEETEEAESVEDPSAPAEKSGVLPVEEPEQPTTYSGTCGDDLTWILDETGTLTISGTGPMTDFCDNYDHYTDNPWKACRSSVQTVVIEQGVTSIGAYAFYGCSLKDITIANTVKTIGNHAFDSIGDLTSITIPDSVTTIGEYAFLACSSLADVTFGKGVQIIDHAAFYRCKQLKSVILPEGLISIGGYAFSDCEALENLSIPDSIVFVENAAFQGCKRLSYTVYESAKYLGNAKNPYAVLMEATDRNLTSYTVPKGTRSIGDDAFAYYRSLVSITLPDGLLGITSGAFRYCEALKSIIIPDSVVYIGLKAFSSCESLTSVTIGKKVQWLGEDAFLGCDNLKKVYIKDLAAWCNIEFNWTNPLEYGATLYLNNKALTSVTIPNGVKTLKTGAFRGYKRLTSITIPNSVQVIEPYALENCILLTSVSIGNNVKTIGYNAFSGCVKLKRVSIPASVETIEKYAFCNCTSLAYLTLKEGLKTIGNSAFAGCTKLTGVTIPSTVESLGTKIFHSCTQMESATIKASISEIPEGMFYKCERLKNLTLPSTLKSIGSSAFYNCYKLKKLVLPEGLETIGSSAFSGATLSALVIPDSVKTIGDRAFYFCDGITSLTIPGTVTEIGINAFTYCRWLKSVVIHEGIATISPYMLSGCTRLQEVTIPKSVTKIEPNAFNGCPAFTKVNYAGEPASWDTLSSGISTLSKVTVSFPTNASKLASPSAKVIKSSGSLKWAQVSYAEYYEVYRATSQKGAYTLVATVEGTSWTDPAGAQGTTCYYKVQAVHTTQKQLRSGYSNIVSIAYACDAPVISAENGSSGKPIVSWEKVSGAKQYTVYVATAQNGTYKKLGTSKTLSYTDSKAKAGYTYFYKVIANGSKSSYNSGYSNIVSCGVICGAPSVSVKVDANTGKPSLSWKKVDAATGYAIYRDGELLTTVTAVTYADTTAAIDTQYSYAVQALGKTEDLNGSLSKAVSVTSGIAKPKLTGKVNAEGQPILTWDAVEGAVKYEIYRSTKSSKSYKLVATVETLTYGDYAFAAGTAYYYKVKAIGAVSKSAESSYVKLTGKCATPVISAEAGQSGKSKISWEKVTGAKQYTVYRATSENGKYSKLGTTKSNTYEDKKAAVGKTYFYKVIANGSKSSGNSAYSNIVSCSVRLAAPKIKSYGPSDTQGDPLISWEKVSGAKGYRILRKLPGETEFKVIKEWNETYFRDMDAPLFAECTYIMQTIGSKPEYDSVYTEEMTILSTMGQPNVTCLSKNNGASLTWYAVEGAVSYDVFVSDTKDGAFTLLLNTKSTGYLHTDAQPNRDYYYKVVAIGESGLRVEGYVNKLCIRCATPRVTLELDAVSGKPVLTWEAVEGATKGYEIYRATSGGKLKKLKTVKTLRFVDTSATPGGDYRYEVRALGSGKDYNSKWEETGYIAAKCAQPKATVKLNKSGDPVVSWKKVSGAKQYMVMYVDVTDFVLSGTEPSESYLQQHMQYVQTSKTSVTLTKAESDRVYIITMIAVPKNQECFSTPSDPVIVITE